MIMLPLELSYSKSRQAPAPEGSEAALVLGVAGDASVPKELKGAKDVDGAYQSLLKIKGFEGRPGSSRVLLQHGEGKAHAHLVGFGIGGAKDCHAQNALSWGASLARVARDHKFESVDVMVDSLFQPAASVNASDAPRDFAGRPLVSGIPAREEFLELLAVGAALGLYEFTRFNSKGDEKADKKKDAKLSVRFVSASLDARKAADILRRAATIAEGVYLTRDLQNTPSNELFPAELARQAAQAGKLAGFDSHAWDEKKLKAESMGGILAVGQGSANPPRLIFMEHNAGKKNLPLVVYVGKGITFDTGGISIKPAAGMEEMKMDMSGAAAVIGAMYTIAKLDLPVRVLGMVPAAENMPSGTAIKPGDVYTAHDGQTVEVINTDAEGRLVLSEALAYAKSLDPLCVIDVATLTGAVVVALGNVACGIMGNDAQLLSGFRQASERVGERVWELPLYDEYRDDLKSKTADYRNSGSRDAGSQKGGTFLNFFVKNAYPWIHVDIAGLMQTKQVGAHAPAESGSGVANRGLVEFARNLKNYFNAPAKKTSAPKAKSAKKK